MCEIRSDHDWGGWVIKGSGRDRVYGPYYKMERTCRKCGRRDGVTEYGMKVPEFDPGFKIEEKPR